MLILRDRVVNDGCVVFSGRDAKRLGPTPRDRRARGERNETRDAGRARRARPASRGSGAPQSLPNQIFDLPLLTPGTYARAHVYQRSDASVAVLVQLRATVVIVPAR